MHDTMIQVPVASPLIPEIQKRIQEKVYYLHPALRTIEFTPTTDGATLTAHLAEPLPDAVRQELAARLGRMAEKVVASFQMVTKEILYERSATQATPPKHPFAELVASEEVIPLREGGYAFRGRFLELLHLVDREVLSMADAMNAEREEYPPLTPVGPLVKSGYIASFPHYLVFAYHLREDMDVIEAFARENAAARDADALRLPDASSLAPAKLLLSPTICYNCFEAMAATSLPDRGRVVTAAGKCHRYEYRNLCELERLRVFTMREIIFMGTRDFTIECRKRLIDMAKRMAERFDLTCAIASASDPFFTDGAMKKRPFQEACRLKYELSAALPGRGDRSLAVASFNLHQATMADAYGITLEHGQKMHSGCIGYGFERFCFAFIAQHGLEPERWPPYVRAKLEDSCGSRAMGGAMELQSVPAGALCGE